MAAQTPTGHVSQRQLHVCRRYVSRNRKDIKKISGRTPLRVLDN
jgi:hypothetical protein